MAVVGDIRRPETAWETPTFGLSGIVTITGFLSLGPRPGLTRILRLLEDDRRHFGYSNRGFIGVHSHGLSSHKDRRDSRTSRVFLI